MEFSEIQTTVSRSDFGANKCNWLIGSRDIIARSSALSPLPLSSRLIIYIHPSPDSRKELYYKFVNEKKRKKRKEYRELGDNGLMWHYYVSGRAPSESQSHIIRLYYATRTIYDDQQLFLFSSGDSSEIHPALVLYWQRYTSIIRAILRLLLIKLGGKFYTIQSTWKRWKFFIF